MEIKARLKKPFLDDERLSFIVENNHLKGWQINETDTELQALGYSDLEINRALKLNELKSIKDEKLASFEFKDNVFQLDSDSKVNINGKISQILLSQAAGVPIENINWINKDNRVVSFSKDEFIAFGIAAANHSESVLFKHDGLRTRVNSASSIDELKEIEWIE